MKRPLRLPGLAALVALMGIGVPADAGVESAKRAGSVAAVAGPVTVTRPEERPQSLNIRDPLYWRDIVEVHKDGIARLQLGEKAQVTVTVRELSRVELYKEARADGVRYIVELVSGKVRASVARMLMRSGEQVEVRTRNAVASVRGTDFIVGTIDRPATGGAFGLLGAREVAQGVEVSGQRSWETVLVALSGRVEMSNRLARTGRTEQIRAYEGVRVSGRQEPVRVQISAEDLTCYLQKPNHMKKADEGN